MGTVGARVAAALLTLLAPPAGPATPAPGTSAALAGVDVTAFPEVSATVAVPPALAGRALPPSAFTVTEGGRAVAARVTALPAAQVEVVLVVDTSGSMVGEPLAAAKRAARSFLAAMPATARIAVVGFGASPELASRFSLDRAALSAAVEGLAAGGETALYDAVVMAMAQFSQQADAARSIVLLSDGGDTASRTDLATTVGAVAAGRVQVDVVELASSEADAAALVELARGAGGRVVPATDPAALDAIYRGLATTLANQYQVAYRSDATAPVELRVAIAHEGVTTSAEAIVAVPPAPGPAPAEKPASVVGGRTALLVGLGSSFVALCLAGLVLFLPRRAAVRRVAWSAMLRSTRSTSPSALTGLAGRAAQAADAALDRRGRRGRLNATLERAGIALRPGEFLVLSASGALTALLLGLALSGPLAGLAGAALAITASRSGVAFVARRRQARFAAQLTDTLQLMTGTLRAGYGLLQALDAMAREAPAPTGEEFRRIVVESRLGRDLSEALRAMSTRMGSQDFQWVVEAIEINREVGGDLAEVLDRVATTVRERDYLRRQVKSLSAEGRLSGYLLMALPGALALMIRARNPTYFAELTQGPGLLLSGVGVILLAVGGLWLRKVCRIAF